ncbi:PREDICTED: uncharacterized protein LOC104593479 [Nelumbo nucifera]|uniref:Uncharacterized protein LOC104593479 n=2 Tax=Nelumbo nucifera TaxID=4432 RepID=A0A1U7ZS43_NELNU|nr:PREDICTED: uncharacterized protein LOC104593479 [Nelumbo nucifera]DAD43197.1 TPA_asm: hypothetical protein HUJ06_001427 [Nelumbo nucifera]
MSESEIPETTGNEPESSSGSSTNSKIQSAIESLISIVDNIPPSLSSSENPATSLLHDPDLARKISSHLRQPNSGAGDNHLCRWLYDTFQSSDPTLQLVVLRFLPIIAGVYLSRVVLRVPLAGFEAVLLAIYAHETTSRGGQALTVNVPDLSHSSIYHETKVTTKNNATGINLAIFSPSLEPHGTVRSTKRARIVGVALELYYSKISHMPIGSKMDFCEFCVAWAGQDGDMYKDDQKDPSEQSKPQRKHGEDKGGRRIPLPWELLQPALRVLGHCLMGPNDSKELKEAASAASRSLYARALHDVNPQAILATGSLLRLGKLAMADSTDKTDPTEIPDLNNPIITI